MAHPGATKPSRNRHRAMKRQAEYDMLSPQEKLAKLDERFGVSVTHDGKHVGNGAKKERARLNALIKEQGSE